MEQVKRGEEATMGLIPEEYFDVLESKSVAHIATLGPHGEPQSNPVWFLWDGTYLSFSITTERQKYQNVKRDPHIAVSITHPQDPGRYIELRGVARIEQDSKLEFLN